MAIMWPIPPSAGLDSRGGGGMFDRALSTRRTPDGGLSLKAQKYWKLS